MTRGRPRVGMPKAKRDAFLEVVEALKFISRRLEGRNGDSVYDRLELKPGYDELQKNVDRAIVWAEEMNWIIVQELS